MMFKKTEAKYEPDPRLERALDVLFILHADHEQNCSTNAVRGVGSSQVDPYSAVAAGVAALYGPLHGGANEAVLRMLRRIETVENIPDFLEGVKNREERLMGFGHRVYKNYDPRARIIKKHMDEVFEATEYNPLVEIARELEKRALDDDYFTSRKLYPNVDFYSGIIYEALQIPTEMFTVIFAIPRTSGWVSQWMEMNDDPEQKIARPRQIYIGERDRDYVPIERPRGPREDHRPAGPPAEAPAPRRVTRFGRDRLAAYRLTIRHGSDVTHERFASLDAGRSPRSSGRRRGRSAARGRWTRSARCATTSPASGCTRASSSPPAAAARPRGGVDVMGDGALVPYAGVVRKRRLEPRDGETAFDAVREALAVTARGGGPEGKRRRRSPRAPAARRRAADRRLRQRDRADRGRRLRAAGAARSSSAARSSRSRSAGCAGWRCSSACSAPTASTRRWTSSTASAARSKLASDVEILPGLRTRRP